MKKIIFNLLLLSVPNLLYAEYPEITEIKSFAKAKLEKYSLALSSVDPKYEGVIAFGKSLKTFSEKSDLVTYTTHSKDYWRALLEMVPTDPSILLATAYMHFLKGEITYGEQYLLLGRLGMDDSFRSELNEYQVLQTKLTNKIQAEMQKGIKLHDQEKYKEALAAYDAVTQEYPNCAWAWYEKGFTYSALGYMNKKYESQREKMYHECRSRDPFYWMAYQGKDKEALDKLVPLVKKVVPFSSGEKKDVDGLIGFAEGCREIKLYAFAAHAEWKLAAFDTKKMKTHIKLFLENLKSLGLKEIDFFKLQFKLDK